MEQTCPKPARIQEKKNSPNSSGGGQDACKVAINFRFIYGWIDPVSREESKEILLTTNYYIMKTTTLTKKSMSLAALAGLALTGSANAATVWNVNIGSEDITGYQGAATENPVTGSTWNAVTTTASTTLDDSSGDNSAGVAIAMTSNASFGNTGDTTGDEIFKSWMKDDNNSDPYTVTFSGLNPAATYSLVVYSGWRWGPDGVHVGQSAGTGLDGTFIINSLDMQGSHPLSSGLAEDTNAADVAGDTNYARFNGLVADGSNNLAFDFLLAGDRDAPINGFQLIETIPEPSTTALLGLGGLALILRRRK